MLKVTPPLYSAYLDHRCSLNTSIKGASLNLVGILVVARGVGSPVGTRNGPAGSGPVGRSDDLASLMGSPSMRLRTFVKSVHIRRRAPFAGRARHAPKVSPRARALREAARPIGRSPNFLCHAGSVSAE